MNICYTAASENIRMKLNKSSQFICSLELNLPVAALQISHNYSDLSFGVS